MRRLLFASDFRLMALFPFDFWELRDFFRERLYLFDRGVGFAL
jgi:hypothetical protein